MLSTPLGVIIGLNDTPEDEFRKVAELGLPTCQLAVWDEAYSTPDTAGRVRKIAAAHNVTITNVWVGWPGPTVWDFIDGPVTLGLVPEAYRFARMQALQRGSDFARHLGVDNIITHVGFIPENPSDPAYPGLLAALRHVVAHCCRNGQTFCFETGQETPVTLLRTIHDLGENGLGVNLDPANLVLYGKGNPVDAVQILGPYLRGIHIKDGKYPTDGRSLGVETPVGEGAVDFPRLLMKLREHRYQGALTIEREISGPQQRADIQKAAAYIQALLT